MIFLFLYFEFFLAQAKFNYIPQTRIPPSPRAGMGISYSNSMKAFYTFGGLSKITYFSDTWAYYTEYHYWQNLLISSESYPCNL